jgi:C4-dicarboxylate transporter DctQ subunit
MPAPGRRSAFGRVVNEVEETLIALLLGLMTLLTFANVVARYVFSDNILWALEVTGFLNAWMILIGVGYCMKVGAHLGVDALVNALPRPLRRWVTLLAAGLTLVFCALMMVGAWNYWAPFAGLPPLYDTFLATAWNAVAGPLGLPLAEGSWFPQAFFEVEDTPMPAVLQGLAAPVNDGEPYEKMPRFIPYAILPLGMALLTLRTVQATLEVWRGEREMLIASHEAEEAVDEASARARQED